MKATIVERDSTSSERHQEARLEAVASPTDACEALFAVYLSCAQRYAESVGMLRDECRSEARAYRECMIKERKRDQEGPHAAGHGEDSTGP
ncbi:hypothetical protein CCYA_CCYA04G1274 [Cyanidiococcus yangmingshanensis]|nr:hypothetical protein CCYA_CCYA04G1274 [Cyanidiococcus yangmingshanensis]